MNTKETISIKEMMKLSNELYEMNKHKWGEKTPESNIYRISFLVAEIGEVIDIVKKKGVNKVMKDEDVRNHMLEEISDCYMYLADILNRYEFSPEEFTEVYKRKMSYNCKRDYSKEYTEK